MKKHLGIPALAIAGALGLAALPALAQTPPAPTGSGADLVGGADHPYGNAGLTPGDTAQLSHTFGSPDRVVENDSIMDQLDPNTELPGLGRDTAENGGSTPPASTDADAGAGDGDSADNGGMSADEYANHLDKNADAWDDLADGAADPADAAGWRKHARDLRAEAARARAQAAKDKARQAALLQQSNANTVGTAVNVAVNSGIRTAVNGASQAAHSATRSATVAVRPRVETPRFVIMVEPGYRY